MIKLRIIITIFILFFISSCTNNLRNLARHEPELKQRKTFNAYLALEYLQYSRDLANKYNWRDSYYFSEKGLNAYRNHRVHPEVPESWDIDSSQIEEATLGRQKLVMLLSNSKANYYLPIQLAHLQLLYDCWISREKEPWQLADMARCKVLFFRLEEEIKDYLNNLKAKKEIKIVPIKQPEFTRFDAYFDFNSYKFNSESYEVFEKIFRNLESLNGNYRILLVGNADRSGKKLYNAVLARKRVLMVRNRLIRNGVPDSLVAIKSYGEDSPQIITKNNTKNKNNRRVSIYILKGKDDISTIPLPLIDSYIYKQDIIKSQSGKI